MSVNSQIVPTILVDNLDKYEQAIKTISQFANHVQIDLTDGLFAPSQTVKLDQIYWPEGWTADLHMMVEQPSLYLKLFERMKPNLVIFHAEAREDLLPVMAQLKSMGIRAGVALMRPTVPENFAEVIRQADHVLIFAGELGKMGGEASMMQTEKVRLIRKINHDVEIGWDGGANIDNVFTIARAGVDVINVGSALAFANDPVAVYAELVNQVAKTGVV